MVGERDSPSKRVMYSLDKLEIVDCIASKGWRERHRKVLEMLQVLPQVDVRNVIDDVQ